MLISGHQKAQIISKQQYSPFWAEYNKVCPAIFVEVTNDWFADWLTRQ